MNKQKTGGRNDTEDLKDRVRDFWNAASCGEKLYLTGGDRDAFNEQRRVRYELEPIPAFADFNAFRGKKTLEIGVGLGADHQSLAEAGANLSGIDLTERAVAFTRARFDLFGLRSDLRVADAERLPFADSSFDAVYSWGVLHHSPNTATATSELMRVLRPGGSAKVMIYNKHSMVGYMLWLRYGLGGFRPWRRLDYIYAHYLESPGTKAYSYQEAEKLFPTATSVKLSSPLGHGDLLTSKAGQRHQGLALKIARLIWPRWFITRALPNHGLGLMISLTK
ncbi:MAG: Demethylrebeccamycin-D-glucose O-methyltransferase [Verrucomicrobiota bacterium]|jgi:ubiquinone/menaquinone biosynthesis C-methylase UbiE